MSNLKRSLTLWDLILYGVIVIQPVAPMSVFGVLSTTSRGHAATVVLLALAAMLPTAVSYGRMARVYPTAGSAFTYVAREISPWTGYVTGWAMVMDYLLNPAICIIWISQQLTEFGKPIALMHMVPYAVWAAALALLITALNLQRIEMSARVNALLALGMGVVIVVFFVAAVHYVAHGGPADTASWLRPFYDPTQWKTSAVIGGTSVAVLTYIGFDGISTLAEEARDPRRHILWATVLTCCVIGLLSALEVYAAQRVWPGYSYPNVDTAFTSVAGRAWLPLTAVLGITLIVANFGSALGAQIGAARLLYGMGRSGALPPSVFAALSARHGIPHLNVLLTGAIALALAWGLPAISANGSAFELGVNLLNFGALIAFMGVNAADAVHRWRTRATRGVPRTCIGMLLPLTGMLICAMLWWHLSREALMLGLAWAATGIAYGAWRTRGFALQGLSFDANPNE